MRSLLFPIALLVGVLGFRDAPKEPRIMFVDVSRLVSEHRQSRAEQTQIDEWYKTNLHQLEDGKRMHEQMKQEMDQYKEESDEYRQKAVELKVKEFELQTKYDSLQKEVRRRIGKSIAASYGRVTSACGKYLESTGFDAVLQYASSPVDSARDVDVSPQIAVRTVVVSKTVLDATDAVLAILDSQK